MDHTNKEWLYHQYIELGKSYEQIALEVERDFSTIYYWIKKHKIPARVNYNKSPFELNKNKTNCVNCGKEILRNPYRKLRSINQYCSKSCKYQYSVGENANHYHGSTVNQSERFKPPYIKWRNSVLERDARECQKCGSVEKLEVHHLLPYSEYKDLRLDIDNGITLCNKCHREIHKTMNEMKIWSKP